MCPDFSMDVRKCYELCNFMQESINDIAKRQDKIIDSYYELSKNWSDNILVEVGNDMRKYSNLLIFAHKELVNKYQTLTKYCSTLASYNDNNQFIIKDNSIQKIRESEFKVGSMDTTINTDIKAIKRFEDNLKNYIDSTYKSVETILDEYKSTHRYWDDDNYVIFERNLERTLDEMRPIIKDIVTTYKELVEKRKILESANIE